MATKRSSFFLAVLFIANPFMLLFYQNCSVAPTSASSTSQSKISKSPASENKVDYKVQYYDRHRD